MARVLFGVNIPSQPPQLIYACSRAAGKDMPDKRQELSLLLNSSGSSRSISAADERTDMSSFSAPNTRKSIFFNEFNNETAPDAKNSALDVAKAKGSSKTISAPQLIAAAARVCFGAMAMSPRCVKYPLSTTTMQSALVMRLASCIIYS